MSGRHAAPVRVARAAGLVSGTLGLGVLAGWYLGRGETIDATMIVGVLIALAIGFVVDVWQTDRRRTALLESVKGALEGEVVERRAAQAALKAANQDLEEKARELARSNADLEQFAYLASHDLQEPLRMVGSYAGLLVRRYQGKLDSDADEFAGHIMDGVARMRTLIGDLLVYSRAGTLRERPRPADSEAALALALRNLESAIGEAGAAVSHDGLPAVGAHDTELVQLFQNLIGNAIKFRSAAPPSVHVSAERRDGEWCFAVRDNGIGMDPRHGERIFGLFQRLHRREEYGGTGIGLAICKRIVERRGGRIWVESTPGRGATFFFILPAGEAAPAVTAAAAQTGGRWKAA